MLTPNDATLFERVRILSLTDPRAAVAMAEMLAPVAAPAMIARLDSDANAAAIAALDADPLADLDPDVNGWADDDEYAQIEDTTYDGKAV